MIRNKYEIKKLAHAHHVDIVRFIAHKLLQAMDKRKKDYCLDSVIALDKHLNDTINLYLTTGKIG